MTALAVREGAGWQIPLLTNFLGGEEAAGETRSERAGQSAKKSL